VRALPERADLEIRFPRVAGYRRELSDDALFASYDESSTLTLSLADLPTSTTVSGIVGQSEQHTLESLRGFREQQVAFRLAKLVLDRHLRDPQGNERPWYFPQVLPLVQEWLREHVVLKDDTFLGLLLLAQHADAAVDRIGSRINWLADNRNEHWLPLLRPYDAEGSTVDVDFDTGKDTFLTDPGRCPVTHVVLDSGWEQKVAQVIESLPEVAAYVKNDHLGFVIPYTLDGEQRSYLPDFLVRARVAEGDTALTLVVEVSGATRRDKTEKVRTARDLWMPAVNAHGGFGRWRFLEIKDPYDCRQDLLTALTFEPLVPV
jgi:type III restriction enzyme